jgi:hypothetical protein
MSMITSAFSGHDSREKCPFCGCEGTHIEEPIYLSSVKHGSLMCGNFWCEDGCYWIRCYSENGDNVLKRECRMDKSKFEMLVYLNSLKKKCEEGITMFFGCHTISKMDVTWTELNKIKEILEETIIKYIKPSNAN